MLSNSDQTIGHQSLYEELKKSINLQAIKVPKYSKAVHDSSSASSLKKSLSQPRNKIMSESLLNKKFNQTEKQYKFTKQGQADQSSAVLRNQAKKDNKGPSNSMDSIAVDLTKESIKLTPFATPKKSHYFNTKKINLTEQTHLKKGKSLNFKPLTTKEMKISQPRQVENLSEHSAKKALEAKAKFYELNADFQKKVANSSLIKQRLRSHTKYERDRRKNNRTKLRNSSPEIKKKPYFSNLEIQKGLQRQKQPPSESVSEVFIGKRRSRAFNRIHVKTQSCKSESMRFTHFPDEDLWLQSQNKFVLQEDNDFYKGENRSYHSLSGNFKHKHEKDNQKVCLFRKKQPMNVTGHSIDEKFIDGLDPKAQNNDHIEGDFEYFVYEYKPVGSPSKIKMFNSHHPLSKNHRRDTKVNPKNQKDSQKQLHFFGDLNPKININSLQGRFSQKGSSQSFSKVKDHSLRPSTASVTLHEKANKKRDLGPNIVQEKPVRKCQYEENFVKPWDGTAGIEAFEHFP